MYYKLFLSNSIDWIHNEIFNELGAIAINNNNNYNVILKTNHIIVNCYGLMNEEEQFISRFRIIEIIKKNKLYIHLHFTEEQISIIEKILSLCDKTYKERIINFYKIHNPKKNIDDIDSILIKYDTNMELLFLRLKKQYNSILDIF